MCLVFQILTTKLLTIFVEGSMLVPDGGFRESIMTVPHYTNAHEMISKRKTVSESRHSNVASTLWIWRGAEVHFHSQFTVTFRSKIQRQNLATV
jgi:hypothetical protein